MSEHHSEERGKTTAGKFLMAVVGALIPVLIVVFLITKMVFDIHERDLPASPAVEAAAIAQRIQPVGSVSTTAGAAVPVTAKTGAEVVKAVCSACHAVGVMGAPKIGNKADWAPHIKKGYATLVQHALHGFTGVKGTMPAKGGDPRLSDLEVERAVAYMADKGGAHFKAPEPKAAAVTAPVTAAKPASGAGALRLGKKTFEGTCIACHGAGIAGAPKAGDKTAWAPHVAKGKPTLYRHALHGFTGKTGTMPAKGGNPSLSDADVKAAVNYMLSLVK